MDAGFHFIDWNTRSGGKHVDPSAPGFAFGGMMIEQFELIMRTDVDAAHIWPVNAKQRQRPGR